MPESKSHKAAKRKAAGPRGKTEVPISRRRRLDALSSDGKTATEVERTRSSAAIKKAVRRLEASKAPRKHLKVPHQNLDFAEDAAKGASKSRVTISNLSGTKRRLVGSKKSKRTKKKPVDCAF